MNDLFDDIGDAASAFEPLAEGAVLLRGFAAAQAGELLTVLDDIVGQAPFRHMATPGGRSMSVAMTNCGAVGWTSDRAGYRYAAQDPETGRPWPVMPTVFWAFAARAAQAADYAGFDPDSCLINRYAPGTRLTLHQDRNERDFTAPIVSVSLGLPAVFLFGGAQRQTRPQRVRLVSGDVVVWGGPARLAFHGVAPLAAGNHRLTGGSRINLTFRRAV
jgi:DNA oxidative demethylase